MRDIELRTHVPLYPGQRARLELAITAERDTKVDHIDVRIVGDQGWYIRDGSQRCYMPDLQVRLMGPGVLAAGTRELATTFQLPAHMPPSHRIAPAWARLRIKVDVGLPWWPDPYKIFDIPVRLPPPVQVVRVPVAMRSPGAAGEPRLELGLASTRLVAGEVVTGACAVFHVDDRKPREVELMLVPLLGLRRPRGRLLRPGSPFVFRIVLPAGSAGRSMPFSIRLPAEITPSFETVSHALAWHLVARTGSTFGQALEVRVPLELVDAGAAAQSARLAAAPPLSDQRVATAFDAFARAHGWRAAVVRDPDEQHAVEREAGDATLRLGYANRGERGTHVVARVVHPPLGLGMAVTPSTALRELVAHDIEIDLAAWDRTHHVVARAADQTVPFLRAVVPALVDAAEPLGRLARWTDDALVFERPAAGAVASELERAGSALERIATAIAAAPIAPPPGVTVELHAWQELARALGGRLVVGDLSIDGRLDQLDVAVALRWDDALRPSAIAAHVGPAASAGGGDLTLAHPVVDCETEPVAAPVRDLLSRWPADFVDLSVADGIASAAWRLGDGQADAARVRELVMALRSLLAALEPGAGPYR